MNRLMQNLKLAPIEALWLLVGMSSSLIASGIFDALHMPMSPTSAISGGVLALVFALALSYRLSKEASA